MKRSFAAQRLQNVQESVIRRVGYTIASKDLTEALRKVHDFTTVCVPTPLQEAMAAVIGMPDAYYEWLRDFYASRRSRMLGILESHGFRYTVPEGAYYVMGDSRHLGRGLVRFAFSKKDEPLDETESRFARLSGRS